MEWYFFCFPWLHTLCVSIDWIYSTVCCVEGRRESSKALKPLSSDCERCMTQHCGAVFKPGTPQVVHAGQKVFVFICSSCFNICCLYWEQPHTVTPLWMLVFAFLNLNNTETNWGLFISVGIAISGSAAAAEGLIPNGHRKGKQSGCWFVKRIFDV